MKKRLMLLSLCLASTMAFSATVSQQAGRVSQENSKITNTADSQMLGTDADVELTRKLRDRLTSDESLSSRAQNITIVTRGKSLTLTGMVDSQEEIRRITNLANQVVPNRKIRNELRVEKK